MRPTSTTAESAPAIDPGGMVHDQAQLSFLTLFRLYSHILSLEERHLLRLVEIRRYSYAEVARRFETTAEAVKRQVFECRRRIFSAMAPTLLELA